MTQIKKPFNAFVYIVESPGDFDLLDSQNEGQALTAALKLCKIPSTYGLACNRETFIEALTNRLRSACHANQCFPILHFSMHGNHDGIGLTSKEFISWNELRNLLLPLNREMQGRLIICFSSCFGIYSYQMEYNDQKDPCFGYIVGHSEKLSWSNSAVAYISFYNRLFGGGSFEQCIQAMKISTGDDNFEYLNNEDIKKAYIAESIKKIKSRSSNSPITFFGDI